MTELSRFGSRYAEQWVVFRDDGVIAPTRARAGAALVAALEEVVRSVAQLHVELAALSTW